MLRCWWPAWLAVTGAYHPSGAGGGWRWHAPPQAGRCRAPRACSEDWRSVRARLVKQEQAEASGAPKAEDDASGEEEYVFATPLIEQGSVILGGTEQEFGFALRQQYFHKSVMLLLQHDEQFTKGIILNRPSALELDGWRVWFGGDVAEGGFFKGEAVGEKEIVCLHSLESEEARTIQALGRCTPRARPTPRPCPPRLSPLRPSVRRGASRSA